MLLRFVSLDCLGGRMYPDTASSVWRTLLTLCCHNVPFGFSYFFDVQRPACHHAPIGRRAGLSKE